MIRLISTLLKADRGSAKVFGIDADRDEMAVKKLISRVSVDAAFFKKLSPLENLVYGARLYGVPGPEAKVKAYEIMSRLGLERSSYNEPMEEMSRGMQQKGGGRARILDLADSAAARRTDHRPGSAIEARSSRLHSGAARFARCDDSHHDA